MSERTMTQNKCVPFWAERLHRTYIGSAEKGKTVAGRHHDQAESRENGHKAKTFSSAPNIHNFRQRDEEGGGHGIRNNVDDVQEGMRLEVACDEGKQ